YPANVSSRLSLAATAGLPMLLFLTAGITPAGAQAADAAERCTPDVMRLCSEFVPDPDDIVACLKRKGRFLSKPCVDALTYRGPNVYTGPYAPKNRGRRDR